MSRFLSYFNTNKSSKILEDRSANTNYMFRLSTIYCDRARTILNAKNWMIIKPLHCLYIDQVLWLVKAPGLSTEEEVDQDLKTFSKEWLIRWYVHGTNSNLKLF